MLAKKTRLNNDLRAAIVARALVTSGCVAESRQLIEDRAAFAEKVRLLVIAQQGYTDTELRARYEALRAQHIDDRLDGFIYVCVSASYADFSVNINGQHRQLFLNGAKKKHTATHIPLDAEVHEGGRICPRGRFNIANNDLADELNDFDKRDADLEAKIVNVKSTVRAAVDSVNTIGQLLAAWPEAEELLPEEWQKAKAANALAVRPEDLNAICGIPKGKE